MRRSVRIAIAAAATLPSASQPPRILRHAWQIASATLACPARSCGNLRHARTFAFHHNHNTVSDH